MNQDLNIELDIVELTDTAANDVGVELSDLELQAVSGGLPPSWSCGRPKRVDEWG